MPLTPAQRALYPPDWPAISARIRFERAGNRCECDGRCGRPEGHETRIRHDWSRCTAVNAMPHPVTGSRVVLTVAHLDHDLVDHSDANLAAFCQRCHLAYDAAHRRQSVEAYVADVERQLRPPLDLGTYDLPITQETTDATT